MCIFQKGILCYEFLVGQPPFESESSDETYKKICKIDLVFPPYVPKGATDLINKVRNVKYVIVLSN